MALPSTIYRASIQLADIDRNLYETLQTTVAQHPSETAERLVVRLLAYAICFEPDLLFTKGIAAGDEPDLWIKGYDGRVALWIEVGLTEPDRLIKACRHSERVVLFAYGSSRQIWEKQHLEKLSRIPNLTIIGIDKNFLSRLAERLQRSITWSLTITEGSLYLTNSDETHESSLLLLSGPPLSL